MIRQGTLENKASYIIERLEKVFFKEPRPFIKDTCTKVVSYIDATGNEYSAFFPVKHSELNGKGLFFKKNKQVFGLVNYSSNERDGHFIQYDDSGKKILQAHYEKGRIIKPVKQY